MINANAVFTVDPIKLKDTLGDALVNLGNGTELVDSLADFLLFILLKTDLCVEGDSISSVEPILVSGDPEAHIQSKSSGFINDTLQ